jgi:hypothetical protein
MAKDKTQDEKMAAYLKINKQVLDARAKVQVAQEQVRLIRSIPAMLTDKSVEELSDQVNNTLDAELEKLKGWETQKIVLQSEFTKDSTVNLISLKLSELGEWFHGLIYPKPEVHVDYQAIEGTPKAQADFSFSAGFGRVASFLGRLLSKGSHTPTIIVPKDKNVGHAKELLTALMPDVTKVVSKVTRMMEGAINPSDSHAQSVEMAERGSSDQVLPPASEEESSGDEVSDSTQKPGH